MKKMMAAMAFGMAAGIGGSDLMYVEYKSGKLAKMLDMVGNKAKNAADKVK